jgi:NhaP-type Na+/H+ or K+/H+ antiporter
MQCGIFSDHSSIPFFYHLCVSITPHPSQFLPSACAHLCVLSFGGAGLGLAAGFCFRRLLRLLRWHGASVAQEAAAIVSLAYLTYYAAEAMLHVSGVLAVVAFGLYGNAQGYFGLGGSARMPEFRAVQQTVAFALNGLVFFFAGASSVNFLYRAALTLRAASINFALFPLIYAMFLLARGISISCINWGLMRCFGAALLTRGEVVFTTFAGLRGAISLIMAQALLTDDLLAGSNEPFASQVGLWTALMVLSTLIVNAPLVPAALKATGLVHVTPLKRQIRGKCKRALARLVYLLVQQEYRNVGRKCFLRFLGFFCCCSLWFLKTLGGIYVAASTPFILKQTISLFSVTSLLLLENNTSYNPLLTFSFCSFTI